ncbi:MAG: hypothetical protein ABEJ08_05985 [Halobacteriaceae archaeon]
MSYAGSDPCHTRLQNVDSDSFQVRLEEWNYLDGTHTGEQVGYVVLESGLHEVEGEVPIEAGTVQTTHGFSGITFTASVGSSPVVISRCQTHDGGDAVVTRTRNVGPDGAPDSRGSTGRFPHVRNSRVPRGSTATSRQPAADG